MLTKHQCRARNAMIAVIRPRTVNLTSTGQVFEITL